MFSCDSSEKEKATKAEKYLKGYFENEIRTVIQNDYLGFYPKIENGITYDTFEFAIAYQRSLGNVPVDTSAMVVMVLYDNENKVFKDPIQKQYNLLQDGYYDKIPGNIKLLRLNKIKEQRIKEIKLKKS